jgi:hypothetical protein
MLLDIVGRLTRMLWGSPAPPSQRQAGAPDLRLPGRDRLESVPSTSEGTGMATLVVVAARAASGV